MYVFIKQLGDTRTKHSSIYERSLDGYPVYDPHQGANQTLATFCWQARDYSSTITGCTGGARTCLLTNQFDYTKGTTTASSIGPPLTGTLITQSGNTIGGKSGIYYQVMNYNVTCFA